MPDLEAVLLDMDGTLIDTEPFWIDAELAVAAEHGGTWTHEQALGLVGSDLLHAAGRMREEGGVRLPPEAIVDLLLTSVVARTRQGVPWRPGALDLLADLAREGVPTALVTMSWRALAEPVADAVADALGGGGFDTVVTGDVVRRGKPHPEPYLRAAAALGVDPAACVAVEDSATGATSAEEAGCLVVVVPNHVPVPPAPRRVFLPTLEAVDTDTLRGMLVGAHLAVRAPRS